MFAATLVTSAGSTTLPLCALVGGTGARLFIRQIAVYNTTVTEADLILCRLSTAGTPGTSATTRVLDTNDTLAAVGVLKNTYTSTAPTTTDLGIALYVGAAKGSAVILPFGPKELVVPATASAAIGILVGTGTGQAVRTHWIWEEA